MAQAAVISVIGVVSGILGIVSFAQDNFKAPEAVGSVVNIAVGLDYEGGLQKAGGNLPDVRLFNEAGKFLGISKDSGDIGDGEAKDITIAHKSGSGQQATYGLFSANDNAICVAYLTITWPDGNKYGWTGDWGEQCGGDWYYSNVFIQGSTKKPKCLWIDKNGDRPQTGFQIHFPEFVIDSDAKKPPAGKDADYFCKKGPPFQLRTDPDPKDITYWILDGQTKRSAELDHPRRFDRKSLPQRCGNQCNPHLNKLIISNSTEQSTARLCKSRTSRGPDFVNIAYRSFCRMSDKSLWPICLAAGQVDNCFDLDLQQLVIGGRAARDSPYDQVDDWTIDA